jgi:hypothetical protein
MTIKETSFYLNGFKITATFNSENQTIVNTLNDTKIKELADKICCMFTAVIVEHAAMQNSASVNLLEYDMCTIYPETIEIAGNDLSFTELDAALLSTDDQEVSNAEEPQKFITALYQNTKKLLPGQETALMREIVKDFSIVSPSSPPPQSLKALANEVFAMLHPRQFTPHKRQSSPIVDNIYPMGSAAYAAQEQLQILQQMISTGEAEIDAERAEELGLT